MMHYLRPHPRSDSDQLATFLAGCLAGLVVGAALGVLLAPHRGDITRRKLARRAGQTKDQVVEAVEELLEKQRQAKGGEGADQETAG
jgi:gas vesicle protein